MAAPLKPNSRFEAENAARRHQLLVFRHEMCGRVRINNNDRYYFVQLYLWLPSSLQILTIFHPETLIRWYRTGFRSCWRWKSCSLGRRPQFETEYRIKCAGWVDKYREPTLERRVFTTNRLGSALMSHSQPGPNTCSNDARIQARVGAPPFCATTSPNSLPWTCSSFRLLVLTCSIPSSSFVSAAET